MSKHVDPNARLESPVLPSVPERAREWAARTPDGVAIARGRETVSYAELVRTMNALGAQLRPGCSVAVAGEMNATLIAAMCAVLDRGCVLVPLDIDLPRERLRHMIDQARVELVLDAGGAPELGLPTIAASLIGDAAPHGHTCGPDDPAYVFFTSGTTGRPKGILGNHKGLAHFLAWQRERFQIGPGHRCGQLTGLSFDVVMRAVFLPLTSGATLCLPAPGIVPASDGAMRWLERERITIIHTVPSLARHWLESARSVVLPELRFTFFAGEILTDTLVRRWRAVAPNSEIINLYGPTETTLAKCYYVVPATPAPGIQPVGRPLPHSQALVLTPDRELANVGEPGEIWIRTPFRSAGYLDGDSARFVRNPFRNDPTDIIYRTGDVGVLAADGNLTVQGRVDDQVKIRGVRVEPAEVAAVLAAEPHVRGAEVIARGDPERRYLVAYVVMDEDAAHDTNALRSALASKLPAPMIPAAIVFLEEFPLTSNGKVDRSALPTPLDPSDDDALYVEPRTATESQIVTIWEQVLDKQRVGIHDNFFVLGGDSLLAIRILYRLREAFGFEAPPRILFDAPTIAELACLVSDRDDRDRYAAFALGDHGTSIAAATAIQRAQWDMCRDGTNPFVAFRIALQLDGELDVEAMERSLAAVVARHGILRTAYIEREGILTQRVLDATEISLHHATADRLDEVVTQTAERLDVSRGRCLSATLMRRGPTCHVLVLVIHHIGFDAVSEGILLRDLAFAYALLSNGGSNAELVDRQLAAQFIDHAHDVASYARSAAGQADREAWRARLAGACALELPVDFPRDRVDARRDAAPNGFACFPTVEAKHAIASAHADGLRNLARREGATMFMVLLGAFAELVRRLTGQTDICVQSTYTQRHTPESEEMIGFVGNPLVIRLDTSEATDRHDIVTRAKQVVLSAYDGGRASVIDLAPHALRRVNFNFVPAAHHRDVPSFGKRMKASRVPLVIEDYRIPFDLHLWLVVHDHELRLRLLANAELFQKATAERLLAEYAELLAEWSAT